MYGTCTEYFRNSYVILPYNVRNLYVQNNNHHMQTYFEKMAAFYRRTSRDLTGDAFTLQKNIADIYKWLATLPDESFTLGTFGDLILEHIGTDEGLGKAAAFVLSAEIQNIQFNNQERNTTIWKNPKSH